MILPAYRALSMALEPFGPMLLKIRLRRGREDGPHIPERLGRASAPRPDGALIWLHAASVGEAQSALRLIDRLKHKRPGAVILMTSGTVTSARLLTERLPDSAIRQYSPIDLPGATARFVAHWRPDLAIWIESELWPNLTAAMARTGKPMALVNGRMSDRSFDRWRLLPSAARRLLRRFSLVLAQNDEAADRFRKLGATEVMNEGNLKYAADPLPVDDAALTDLRRRIGDRPFWLAASIHPDEDLLAADVHRRIRLRSPRLLTIVAPRHPAKSDEMMRRFQRAGLTAARRSNGDPVGDETDIYVADTMGELGLLYELNGPVFVGGSMIPHGGQNMLEPARFGRCVITGPHTRNFTDIVEDMRGADALIEISDGAELAAAVTRMLSQPAEAATLGERARTVAKRQDAVLERVLARLDPLLPSP